MHSHLALIANAIEAWTLAIGKSFLLVPRQPREADRLSCCDSIPDLYSRLHSKMHILSSLSALADVSRQKRFLANLRHPVRLTNGGSEQETQAAFHYRTRLLTFDTIQRHSYSHSIGDPTVPPPAKSNLLQGTLELWILKANGQP